MIFTLKHLHDFLKTLPVSAPIEFRYYEDNHVLYGACLKNEEILSTLSLPVMVLLIDHLQESSLVYNKKPDSYPYHTQGRNTRFPHVECRVSDLISAIRKIKIENI